MRFIWKIRGWLGYLKAFVIQKLIRPFKHILARINYPGQENINLLDIASFFLVGIQKGDIQARARSISFDFFLAIFPSVIFFFTLIPYIPVDGFQDKILLLLQDVLPPYTFEATRTTIEDILNQPRGGLLSFGFLFALYVSTNGINSLIESFNQSYHGIPVRNAFKQRLVSVFLTLMLAVIVITSIGLIIFAEVASNFLESKHVLNNEPRVILLQIGTWLILLFMALMMISFLYFYGPSKKNKRPFISVGSVTATVLLLITTIGFNYFITHFGQYNKIYGSIGTLIVILVWINFNSLQLIIGFELNASIENALRKASGHKAEKELEKKIYRSM
ncbi:MAG TPA: YihY/virulence factor BrkB family protein [Bacteroidia bacterium]|nr:YihY/virulence factor BrkB family protein [Bacteroidia bacterium]